MPQGRDIVMAKGRIAPVDDVLQIFRRYLSGRDVQRQDVVGKLGKGQVLPALPVRRRGDLFGNIQAAIGGEPLEDDIFERQLCKECVSISRLSRVRAPVIREAKKTEGTSSYIKVLTAGTQIPLRGRMSAIGGAGRFFAVRHDVGGNR